jgi:hypothetical protein
MKLKTIEKSIGKFLRINVDYYSNPKPFCIIKLIEFLQEAATLGATNIVIKCGYYKGDLDNLKIHPISVKIESQKEYENRIAKEEDQKKLSEENEIKREKALYEELKAKYGD